MYNNPNNMTYYGGQIPEVVVTGRRPWVIETDPTNFGYRPGIRDRALSGLGVGLTGMIAAPALAGIAETVLPTVSYRPSPRRYISMEELMTPVYSGLPSVKPINPWIEGGTLATFPGVAGGSIVGIINEAVHPNPVRVDPMDVYQGVISRVNPGVPMIRRKMFNY